MIYKEYYSAIEGGVLQVLATPQINLTNVEREKLDAKEWKRHDLICMNALNQPKRIGGYRMQLIGVRDLILSPASDLPTTPPLHPQPRARP